MFAFLNMGIISTASAQGKQNWKISVTTPKLKEICNGDCALQESTANAMKEIDKKLNQKEQKKVTCKPIKLNTYFPFLWDKIGCNGTEPINQTTAFAYMIKGLMKLVITIIMVVSFLMIVAAGVLMASAWPDTSKYSNGLGIIKNVATALALLGASGVILKLINPNFFV